MSLPAEVRRGEFVYRDVLLVDLGPVRRHPRASPHDIKDLLMPKKGSAHDRDQVAHWYEAQLVHYGLARSRDKNTANVRLMQAITAQRGGLTVPREMVQLEKDLKNEYSTAVKKAVANPRPRLGPAAESGNKKRKSGADGDAMEAKTTTISVKVGDAVVQINQDTQASKRTKVAAGGGKSTTSRTNIDTTTPKANNKTKKTTTWAARNHVRSTVTSPTPVRQKQWTRTENPTQYPKQQQLSRSYVHHSDDNNDDYYWDNVGDEPPPYDSIDFTKQRSSRASSDVSGRYRDGGGGGGDGDPVQISGSYEISVPGIRTLCDLSLRIDHGSGKLWGRFGIGPKDGILRIDDISGAADGETVSFGWRAQDDATGDLRFGRGCFGELTFNGRGRVQGRFVALLDGDDVVFDGSLVDDRGPDATELGWQWDQFPERAYGRA